MVTTSDAPTALLTPRVAVVVTMQTPRQITRVTVVLTFDVLVRVVAQIATTMVDFEPPRPVQTHASGLFHSHPLPFVF